MITISASPHTKAAIAMTFNGIRSNDTSYWGYTSNPSFEIEVRGHSKLFE